MIPRVSPKTGADDLGNMVCLDERSSEAGRVATWISGEPDDRCWDDLLLRSGAGQFQQSTFWMKAKRAQGWSPVRAIVTVDGEPAGGFQVLWRRSILGRAGYVSKGPVILHERRVLADYVVEMLRAVSLAARLRVLIVQPPDLDVEFPPRLRAAGFLRNVVYHFNAATWMVDLRRGFAAVEKGMNRATRQNVRQAEKQGVRIREAGREDLATFFEMMLTTCARQQTKPQPASVEELRALWDVARPGRLIRLTLAERDGELIAGLVSLAFGGTVTFWKKGWTTRHARLHPNELLMYEALRWSHGAGYQFCDYAALDPAIAVAMLSGKPLTDSQKKSRHMFNVRLGGFPRLVPEAQIHFPSSLLQLTYRTIGSRWIARSERESSFPDAYGGPGHSHAR